MTVLYILVSLFICGALVSVETLSDADIIDIYNELAPPTNNNVGCFCVRHYLCEDGYIVDNGKTIIDPRSHVKLISQLGFCKDDRDVCCKEKHVGTVRPPRHVEIPPIGCGYRRTAGVKITIPNFNERQAQFGEFPWIVAVLAKDDNFLFAGTLIHPQLILTVAHNVINRTSFKVRAGEWDSVREDEPLPYQERDVHTVLLHPQYDDEWIENNIALLYVKQPFVLAEHIDTLCLPPQGTLVNSGTCYVSGWGKENFGVKHKYQHILKKIDVPIVPNSVCQKQLRETRLGNTFSLPQTSVCAGGEEGKDACTGDGGGPLMCPIPGFADRFRQIGIVSWGIGCGQKNVPGVYTDVALYKDWIDSVMHELKLDTSFYQYANRI